jgi:hypothetical protein
MDLGVLSEGMAGAKTAGAIIIGLFVIFSIVAMSISLPVGAVVFAFLTPLPFMKRRTAIITSLIAGSLIILFVWGVVENLMLPIWPQVPLREFLNG